MKLSDLNFYLLLLVWVVTLWNGYQRGKTIKKLLEINEELVARLKKTDGELLRPVRR